VFQIRLSQRLGQDLVDARAHRFEQQRWIERRGDNDHTSARVLPSQRRDGGGERVLPADIEHDHVRLRRAGRGQSYEAVLVDNGGLDSGRTYQFFQLSIRRPDHHHVQHNDRLTPLSVMSPTRKRQRSPSSNEHDLFTETWPRSAPWRMVSFSFKAVPCTIYGRPVWPGLGLGLGEPTSGASTLPPPPLNSPPIPDSGLMNRFSSV